MNRAEMERVIEGGGSVLHEGKLHTRIETLPTKAQLASSEQEKEVAASDLDAQIAALQKQRDGMNKASASKSEKSEKEPASDLPEDFPMKAVFEKLGFKTVAEIQGKTKEELVAFDGIGEASADKALAHGK